MAGVPYNKHVDNWTVGVLLYEFLCGRAPFEAADKGGVYNRVSTLDLKIPAHFPAGAQDLIRRVGIRIAVA